MAQVYNLAPEDLSSQSDTRWHLDLNASHDGLGNANAGNEGDMPFHHPHELPGPVDALEDVISLISLRLRVSLL